MGLQRAGRGVDGLRMEVVGSRTGGVGAPARVFSGDLALSLSYRALLLAIAVGPASSSFALPGRGSDWTLLRFVDVPLLVIAALQVVPVAARAISVMRLRGHKTASGVAFAAFTAFVGWVGMSWAVQGRAIGGLMVLRLVAAVGIAELVIRLDARRRIVIVKTLVGLVAGEGVVCLAQLVTDGPIGLGLLGEVADPFNRLGPWRAPMGTSYYPYPLSAVALLTLGLVLWALDRRLLGRAWGVAVALGAGVIVGSGYSVVAALMVAGISVAFVVRALPTGVRRLRGSAGLLVVSVFLGSLVVTGASLSEGWLWKGKRSASSDAAQASSGRADQIRIGVGVTKKWPVLGTGPGNFAVMREQYPEFNKVSTDAQIPHSMPVLVAVEAGVPALLLLALAVAAALWRRVRRSLVLVMAMSGYLAGDLMHWYTGFGMMQLGLWFGFLLLAHDEAAQG